MELVSVDKKSSLYKIRLLKLSSENASADGWKTALWPNPSHCHTYKIQSIGLLYKKYLVGHLLCGNLNMKLLVVLRFTCLKMYGKWLALFSLCSM